MVPRAWEHDFQYTAVRRLELHDPTTGIADQLPTRRWCRRGQQRDIPRRVLTQSGFACAIPFDGHYSLPNCTSPKADAPVARSPCDRCAPVSAVDAGRSDRRRYAVNWREFGAKDLLIGANADGMQRGVGPWRQLVCVVFRLGSPLPCVRSRATRSSYRSCLALGSRSVIRRRRLTSQVRCAVNGLLSRALATLCIARCQRGLATMPRDGRQCGSGSA